MTIQSAFYRLKAILLLFAFIFADHYFGQNLVVNGDFSAGNTGFISTDVTCNSAGCLFPYSNNAYAIGPDPHFFHQEFYGADHTTGSGNMMIVNGGMAADITWGQNITVASNASYYFSAWASSVYTTNTVGLDFSINGVSLGTLAAPPTLNTWLQFSASWNSGSATTASITIRALNTSASLSQTGEDFGLDDIIFFPLSATSSFMADQVSGCAGSIFSFSNTSSFASSYSWDFGDGSVSTQTNATHAYASSGVYTVQLSSFSSTNVAISTTTITVEKCTGLPAQRLTGDVKVYPNPVTDKLHLESGTSCTAILHDATGRKIAEKNFQQGKNELDLTSYPKGIYFLTITVNNIPGCMKIVKTE